MIVSSLNSRALGEKVKRGKTCDQVCCDKVDFITIQETKLKEVLRGLCQFLWECNEVVWALSPSIKASGGILFFWDKTRVSQIFTFIRECFVGVERLRYVVVSIYSKCKLVEKLALWKKLTRCQGTMKLGDFQKFLHDLNLISLTPWSEIHVGQT